VRGVERRSAGREGRQSRRSDIEDGAPGGVRSRACTPLACAASNAAAPGAKAGNHDEATSKDGAPGGVRGRACTPLACAASNAAAPGAKAGNHVTTQALSEKKFQGLSEGLINP